MIAYAASWILPTKVSVIFLKVQTSTFPLAYDKLENSGLKLDAGDRMGVDDNAATMAARKAAVWKTVAGKDIKAFCRRNIDQVEVAM